MTLALALSFSLNFFLSLSLSMSLMSLFLFFSRLFEPVFHQHHEKKISALKKQFRIEKARKLSKSICRTWQSTKYSKKYRP